MKEYSRPTPIVLERMRTGVGFLLIVASDNIGSIERCSQRTCVNQLIAIMHISHNAGKICALPYFFFIINALLLVS